MTGTDCSWKKYPPTGLLHLTPTVTFIWSRFFAQCWLLCPMDGSNCPHNTLSPPSLLNGVSSPLEGPSGAEGAQSTSFMTPFRVVPKTHHVLSILA